jgi:hypothetical protein
MSKEQAEQDKEDAFDKDASNLVTVSDRLIYHKKRGKRLVEKADDLLSSGTKGNQAAAIAAFLKFDDAATMYYKSHVSYKASGRFREAADSLIKCAKMQMEQKMFLEAATLYTEAAELYSKVDKGECVRSIRSAISIYCDAGKFSIAAKMERKVADIHFESRHWEEAAFHYKKAANFLLSDQLIDQSDHCLEKAALCFQELNELAKVKDLNEIIAKSCIQLNLRRFQAVDHLFIAALTLFSKPVEYEYSKRTEVIWKVGLKYDEIITPEMIVLEGSQAKYDPIKEQVEQYEEIDFMWRSSKERLFLQNVIKHRMEWDIDGVIDHIYYWNNVRPLKRFELIYLKTIVDEVRLEKARQAEFRRLDELTKEKEVARREARKEFREQMRELGLDEGVGIQKMEEMMAADEEFIQNSKTELSLVWEKHFTGVADKKAMRKRAAAEHEEHVGEMEGTDNEGGEGTDNEGGEGDGGREGVQEEDEGGLDFEDEYVEEESDEEESPAKKEPPKERKRRQKKRGFDD